MIVGFKFMTPTDEGTLTMMTPNLLLAFSDVVRMKRDKILFGSVILLLLGGLLAGNITGFTGILQGPTWFTILLIACGFFLGVVLSGIMWSGPKAALLCTVMGTEGFEEYLQSQLALMSEAIRPENIKLMKLGYKTVKHIQKVIVSMETLLELYEQVQDAEDLYEEIDFLRDYTDLYGFEYVDMTKEVMKNAE